MRTSEDTNELAAALAKAQTALANPTKNATNPHFRSRYADLAEVLGVIRPAYGPNGLAMIQSPRWDPDSQLVTVTTRVAHSSGQWIEDEISAPSQASTAQGIGSTITYLRRYSAAAFAGVAQEDDDAEGERKETPSAPPPHDYGPEDRPRESKPAPAAAGATGDANALGRELMRRCGNDKDKAADLLQKLTKGDKPGPSGAIFGGFRSIARLTKDWQVQQAWERLAILDAELREGIAEDVAEVLGPDDANAEREPAA